MYLSGVGTDIQEIISAAQAAPAVQRQPELFLPAPALFAAVSAVPLFRQ